ncbi:response regulator transcription factor [Marinimicrobium agarilyticum]|uniref:response regulator transcription factor n=1 Tax=Marinimicrobium agarilyticum TaxID=306546 RepID=UPI000488E7E3|nr:response regulator transcription factor [Marinimicrobium agarilyticum]
MKARILISDPQPLVRQGLVSIISSVPEFEVVGVTDRADDVVAKAKRLRPEIILTEMNFPDGAVPHICTGLKGQGIPAKTIVISQNCSGEMVSSAISAGVYAYISQKERKEVIIECIRKVREGRTFFSDEAQQGIQRFLSHRDEVDPMLALQPLLTDREIAVLKCAAEGLSAESTADKLHMSVSTIKNHRKSIFVKLNVPNAPGAVYEAMHRKLIC